MCKMRKWAEIDIVHCLHKMSGILVQVDLRAKPWNGMKMQVLDLDLSDHSYSKWQTIFSYHVQEQIQQLFAICNFITL